MDLRKQLKSVVSSWERIFAITLIVFILFGLVTKLYLSTRFELNSDTVGMGLESLEIGKHGNYLLSGYHVTAADTFFLTELLPFQLIPQILTGYNPLTLKIVSFFIFLLCLLVLSYIVYYISRNLVSALMFAALAANIPADGYWPFAMPTTHNATILFGGIVLILIFSLIRYQTAQKEKPEKRKKSRVQASKIPWNYLVVLLVLVFTTAFSDTIFLIWFLAPYVLVYLFFYKGKNGFSNQVVIAMAALSALAYIIKSYLVPDWLTQPLITRDFMNILSVNLPLFFKIQALYLNKPLFDLINGPFSLGLVDVIALAAFITIILYTIYTIWNERSGQKKFFYLIMATSITLMFIAFMVSEYARDMGGARYLTFTALAILMVISVSYNKGDRLFSVLVLLLLITSAIFTYTYVTTVNSVPNENEYALINYLKDNNLTFGFGTYWDSNVVTYLSGEDVTIRSANYAEDGIWPDRLLSCDRWYADQPAKAFIILENGSVNANDREGFNRLLKSLNASTPVYYEKYDIYPFNWTG